MRIQSCQLSIWPLSKNSHSVPEGEPVSRLWKGEAWKMSRLSVYTRECESLPCLPSWSLWLYRKEFSISSNWSQMANINRKGSLVCHQKVQLNPFGHLETTRKVTKLYGKLAFMGPPNNRSWHWIHIIPSDRCQVTSPSFTKQRDLPFMDYIEG